MKNKVSKWVQPILLLLMLIVTVFTFYSMDRFKHNNSQVQPERIKEAIERASVHCYALEGSYPPDLNYLKENYGIILNHDKYFYYYETFASNIMPYVEVYEKGN